MNKAFERRIMQRSRSPRSEYFLDRPSMCCKYSVPRAISFARFEESTCVTIARWLDRGGFEGRRRGSPSLWSSSRYLFTSLSQRNVFVRDIKGHVSQSNGYATCCHQYDPGARFEILTGSTSRNWRSSSPQRSQRSCRIPSARPCITRLKSARQVRMIYNGVFVSIPVAYLHDCGLPTPSYQGALRRRSIEKPRGIVSLSRRQPSRDLPRMV